MLSNTLVFSKSAALRILKGIATKVEALRICSGSIQVTYRTATGRCSTFISKRDFYQDFVSFRQEGAKAVTVRPWGAGSYENHFECRTEGADRIHTVKALGRAMMCSCEDYTRQSEELGKPECKHVIATLRYLGHSSLSDYLAAKEADTARICAEAQAARESIFAF